MENTQFSSLETDIRNRIMNHVLDNMPLVVYLFNIEEKRNIFTNEQYYKGVGYTDQEFDALGEDCLDRLIHPDDFESLYKFVDELTKSSNDGFHVLVNRCLCKNGKFKWFKNHITILEKDKSGAPVLVLGLSHDITAQIEARQKLFEQIRNIEKVSFTLSHELRHEHSKILGILNFSKDGEMVEIGDLQWLANTIYDSAESIDESIHSISKQLNSIKAEFISLNSTEL